MTLFALGRVASAQPEAEAAPAPSDEPAPPPAPIVTPPAPIVTPPAPIVTPPASVRSPEPLRVPVAPDPEHGFRFGSYGRLIAGTDLRGGKPEPATVVAHGPRIVEPSYLELELSYGFESKRGLRLRPVITLAFDGTLFHDTGEFDAHPALRNMFLDAELTHELSAWVGSRMYRGDDIYLFDDWPLDDQNTIGGGLLYHKPIARHRRGTNLEDVLEVAIHAGVNRLNHPFQFQEIEVAAPEQGATTVVQLNRQRMIASGSASYLLAGPANDLSAKLKVHGEVHGLPSGTRKRDDGTFERLPSDTGYLVGAELSLFGWSSTGYPHRHLNLYLRYAKGLAAFDELAPPTSFGPDLETSRASELTFGISGNWDSHLGNVMLGVLSRRFVDADESDVDPDDGWEYALDVRPLVPVVQDVYAGVDLSYQARFPRGLNVNTLRAEDPAIAQIAPMIVYSPMGPSSYDRPQLRLVYRAAHLDDAARDQFVPDDPRHAHTWSHFLGVEAEWWFNSSTYR